MCMLAEDLSTDMLVLTHQMHSEGIHAQCISLDGIAAQHCTSLVPLQHVQHMWV
jgi:hypothetical protein